MPAWIDPSGGVYGIPDIEGRGLKIGLDHHGAAFDPTTRDDRTFSAEGLQIARMIPGPPHAALRDAPLLDARGSAPTRTVGTATS